MSDRVTISATEITNCLRGIVFKRQKKTAPPLHPEIRDLLNTFTGFGETGQKVEQFLKKFWQSKGVLVSPGAFIPSDEYGFSGRYDAICTIRGQLVLYEIKGVSRSFFEQVHQDKQPRSYNKTQLMIYHQSLLPQYPDIEPRLLYICRSEFKNGTLRGVEILITYTDEEFEHVMERAESVRRGLSGGELPPPAPALVANTKTGEKEINMNAITCRHHALCLDNQHWYMDAKKELGLDTEQDVEQQLADDELPF